MTYALVPVSEEAKRLVESTYHENELKIEAGRPINIQGTSFSTDEAVLYLVCREILLRQRILTITLEDDSLTCYGYQNGTRSGQKEHFVFRNEIGIEMPESISMVLQEDDEIIFDSRYENKYRFKIKNYPT